jgi:hypothetical protein
MTCALETSRSPKYGTFSPSLESFTLASADSQNWNVSRSRATSFSFGAPAATAERLGGAIPPMLEQRASFPAPMCPITSPKLICAGVGLNPYLPAGFADNTDDAILSGCLAAQAGAIERACALHGAAMCIISGGAAPFIAPQLAVPHRMVDNIVLTGLQQAANASDSTTG